MSITLAQIFGGIFGLAVAWLLDYFHLMYFRRKLKIFKKQSQIELEEYKKHLRKSVK
jgi:uncharacterized membrane protein YciS (DUF1049 family)